MVAYILDRLKDGPAKSRMVGDVRGKGLMIGIELVKDQTSREPNPAVRQQVQSLDRNLAFTNMATMADTLSLGLWAPRMGAVLLGIFAALALILASVGIYGVLSHSVTQRVHEVGIRMALGAEKCDVLKMVVGQGLKLAMIGVAIGIAGALALTRFLSSLLYGVAPTDPVTFIAVSLILIVVALAACYIPARRAARVDPMVALRCDLRMKFEG